MIKTLLSVIHDRFPLTALDVGDFARQKVSGMKFQVEAYEAQGLGHVSAMGATGFLGLMKMQTLIITPQTADMPLLSYDLVQAMGKNTLYLEMYDTQLSPVELEKLAALKRQAGAIPDHDPGVSWYEHLVLPQNIYKKGGKAHLTAMNDLTAAFLSAYVETAAEAPVCDRDAKREKSAAYVEGLLSHGGPAADVFLKAIGPDKTAEFFRTVLFGTGR